MRKKSIQSSLQLNFVLVAILPTLAISFGSIIFGYLNAHNNAVKQLEAQIALEELKIDAWIESGQNELIAALNEPYLLERIQVSLKLQNKITYYDYYKEGAQLRLDRYLEGARLLQAISVLDLEGNVILSTNQQEEGKTYTDESIFLQGLRGGNTGVIETPDAGDSFAIAAAYPVANTEGEIAGALLGFIPLEALASLLETPIPEPESSRVLLVDTQYRLLADSSPALVADTGQIAQNPLHSTGIDQAIDSRSSGFLRYRNEQGAAVYGVYRWIPGLDAALLVEQKFSTVLGNILTNQVVNLLIIAVGIGLAVMISVFTARRIATPLAHLAQASTEIASGDFSRTVQLEQEDEIGVLAKAFNSMAAQLRNLVTNLELRVNERTQALQDSNQQLMRRARQMETTSQVSREITSILELNSLLMRVVQLIRSSFDYYHVSIFLSDPEQNRLIWRAGSGSANPENVLLNIDGGSMNGKAALSNEAVIAQDTRLEPSFLPDPGLPATRSELVLPLRMGEQVIGTMDIHQREPGGFSPEDVTVLQSLGDQIAIAIHNALLYEKTQEFAVLEERNRMARELHDSISQLLYSQTLYADAGSKYLSVGQHEQATGYMNQLQESAHQALKEMRLMIYELRPSILEHEGLWGAIEHRLETVERRSGVEAQFAGDPSIKLPAAVENQLYLVAQEALNNVLKHSKAQNVNVSLSQEDMTITFSVTDDGAGFDPAVIKWGLGLDNIRQRAKRVGGTFKIHSEPGKGTQLVICIPGGDEDDE